jgi:hypothetical protein
MTDEMFKQEINGIKEMVRSEVSPENFNTVMEISKTIGHLLIDLGEENRLTIEELAVTADLIADIINLSTQRYKDIFGNN